MKRLIFIYHILIWVGVFAHPQYITKCDTIPTKVMGQSVQTATGGQYTIETTIPKDGYVSGQEYSITLKGDKNNAHWIGSSVGEFKQTNKCYGYTSQVDVGQVVWVAPASKVTVTFTALEAKGFGQDVFKTTLDVLANQSNSDTKEISVSADTGDVSAALLKVSGYENFVQFNLDNGSEESNVGVSWTLNTDTVKIAIKAKTTGYVAIAFCNPEYPKLMTNADAIFGWLTDNSIGHVVAYPLDKRDIRSSEPKASTYVTDTKVEEIDGFTTVSFTRKLNTGVSGDVVISAESLITQILLSIKTSDPSTDKPTHHTFRHSFGLNLKTGAFTSTESSDDGFLFFWLLLAAVIILSTVISIFSTSGISPRFRHWCSRRICRPLEKTTSSITTLDKLTLNIPTTLMDYTLREWCLLVAILGGIISFIWIKVKIDEISTAKAWGFCNSSLLFVATLPTHKHGIWGIVFGSSFERAVKWHRMCARLFLLSQIIHLYYVMKMMNALKNDTIFSYEAGSIKSIYGFLAFVTTVIMASLAFETIRRKKYELFYYFHVPLFLLINIFVWLHVSYWKSRLMVGLSVGLWIADWAWRIFRLSVLHKVKCVNAEVLKGGKDGATRLSLKTLNGKPFNFNAGDYVWINIPAISRTQKHPYTISSCPGEPVFMLNIKSPGIGSFGGNLRRFISAKKHLDDLTVYVDGPYGKLSLSQSPHLFNTVILCAGGIGITPFYSMLLDLAKMSQNKSFQCKTVELHWIVRTHQESKWFRPGIQSALNSMNVGTTLNVVLYITRPDKVSPTTTPVSDQEMSKTDIEAVTNLRKINLLTGRPNLYEILKEKFSENQNMAMLACGPSHLVSSVQRAAHEIKGCSFHKESFVF